jgi:D-Tyr-tRNAtyr deacylase
MASNLAVRRGGAQVRAVVQRVSQASVAVGEQVVGAIGADMQVSLINAGPVTLILEI